MDQEGGAKAGAMPQPEKQKPRETRGIKLDYSTLGDKITMSSATCHKCKVNIPLNQKNVCTGKKLNLVRAQSEKQQPHYSALHHQNSVVSNASTNKRARHSEQSDTCKVRFCDTCLQTVHPESWKAHKANSKNWMCPVCMDLCQCASCIRSKQRAAASQQSMESEALFERPARKGAKQDASDAMNPEEKASAAASAAASMKGKRSKKQQAKGGKKTPVPVKKPTAGRSASKQRSGKRGENTSSKSQQTFNAELQSLHSMSVDELGASQADSNHFPQQQAGVQQPPIRVVQSFPVVADELWGAFQTALANYKHELFDKDWRQQPLIQQFKEARIAAFKREEDQSAPSQQPLRPFGEIDDVRDEDCILKM